MTTQNQPAPRSGLTAEIVTFALQDGVSDDAFLALMAPTAAYASNAPGFVSRQLSKSPDGTWTDYVVWNSLEQAQAAAAGFMEQDFAPAILGALNKETFSMRHQDILWQPQ